MCIKTTVSISFYCTIESILHTPSVTIFGELFEETCLLFENLAQLPCNNMQQFHCFFGTEANVTVVHFGISKILTELEVGKPII